MDSLVLSGSKAKMGDTLAKLRSYVTDACREAGVETPAMHRLKLAVDEIATNIISYGYTHDLGTITIASQVDDNFLTLLLEDQGVEFDPTQRDLPDEDDFNAPLEERDIGGWGIFLTLNGVDEFRYERVGDWNRNFFKVKRGSA
jgi:anti-sigma regulatory factor (Ser/Thr protein kinase)